MSKYVKTAKELFVAIPKKKLSTNFQLNVIVFKARTSLRSLLQSLKQNTESRPGLGISQNNLPVQVIKYYINIQESLFIIRRIKNGFSQI